MCLFYRHKAVWQDCKSKQSGKLAWHYSQYQLQRLNQGVKWRVVLFLNSLNKNTYKLILSVCMAVMFFGAVTGCEFKGQTVSPNNQAVDTNLIGNQAWQPVPQRVRIYPSSRFILTQKRPALEARVELQDEMGDSVKSPGSFHLELLKESTSRRDVMQDKLYSWDVPMVSIEDQQSYFESVTRTYRFVLRLDREIKPDDQLVLAITFHRTDGKLLQTKAILGPDGVRFGQ